VRQPIVHSHRFAIEIVKSVPGLSMLWLELTDVIASITDEEIISEFERLKGSKLPLEASRNDDEKVSAPKEKMSLSAAINNLLDRRLIEKGWQRQSALFQGAEYSSGTRWKLDFSKEVSFDADLSSEKTSLKSGMAVEVAFNHGEAIAWNLLKPVIASELNHVKKETDIGYGVGIIICATNELKKAGAFDNAVGTYDKFLRYLEPMRNQLTVPLLIIGLRAPETFKVVKKKNPDTKKNDGQVVRLI